MAFPRSMRFADRREVKRLLAAGRRNPSPIGLLFTAPAPSRGGRIAFVVSSKVARKSSGRNSIRRKLTELARLQFFGRRAAYDAVILVSPLASSWSSSVLRSRAKKTFEILK